MPHSPEKPRVVLTLEGNIGAGKSTFLKVAKHYLNIDVVAEPTDKWQDVGNEENLLNLFYKDTKRWAYTFQSYAFITRIQQQEESLAKNPDKAVQILERSVYCDRYCFAKNCYKNGTMSPLEWHMYTEWFSWLVETYTTKPDGFVYLQTKPSTCMDRMKKRNRSEESEVSFDYLDSLHKKHEKWLVAQEDLAPVTADIPVLTLACDEEFESNPSVQEMHIEKLTKFIGKIHQQKLEQSTATTLPTHAREKALSL